ncbi:MAG: SCP2 sterol-binding domain-containing protein [Solirubrobacteraceae bacterium]
MDFGFDPQRALDQLRKLAADAPAQLSEGFGRLVREAAPERLEQIMHSPARRPLLDGIFWQLPKQLRADQAAGVDTSVLWTITGRSDDGSDSYLLTVRDGGAQTKRVTGEAPEAKLTITMDGVELLRLVSGNLDPMAAYFQGRVQLAGDVMVAAKLAQLFRMPGAGDDAGEGGTNGDRRHERDADRDREDPEDPQA